MLQVRQGNFEPLRAILDDAEDAICIQTPLYRVVFLNDADLAEELLVSKHKHYHKDPGYATLRRMMGNGLITSEGAFHLRQRRMMQPAFHKKRIAEYAACMVHHARQRGARWEANVPLDLNAEMMGVTLDIIAKTMFDADVSDEAQAVYEALTTLINYSEIYFSPLLGKIFDALPLPASRRARDAQALLDRIIYRFIAEHRASGGDRGDLLSMLLMAQAEDGSGAMTDQQIRDECITLFLAGHETTSIGLSWTWYVLSQHPEIEAALHEEVDAVLGDRPATAEDVPKLDYTRRVFTESMRVFPPVPGFGRQAIQDNTIGPYAIRKGDIVVLAPMAMHRKARWFPDPDRLDPDRWLPERMEGLHKFAYFPFGGGLRKCIGEPFAWMEGILLLATFAQGWRFELAPDAKIGMDPKITLRPRYGMRMIPRRR